MIPIECNINNKDKSFHKSLIGVSQKGVSQKGVRFYTGVRVCHTTTTNITTTTTIIKLYLSS